MTIEIEQINIYEIDRKAEAILSSGYIVPMCYISAENEYKRMFENPEKYDLCDIIKLNRKYSCA